MWAKRTEKAGPFDLSKQPHDVQAMYLRLYARTGKWQPIVEIVSEAMQLSADKARAYYLEKIKPIEDRAGWSEDGLVPAPSDEAQTPNVAPFRRSTR